MSLLSARGDEEVMAEINITPFTDVLLVLLIIFMILAALVSPPGFEKELPNNAPSTPTKQEPKHNIEVEVNNKGVIFVDGAKTDEVGIYRMMYQVAQKKPHRHVDIIADAKAPYGVIIRILDASKEANLDDVGFVTSS